MSEIERDQKIADFVFEAGISADTHGIIIESMICRIEGEETPRMILCDNEIEINDCDLEPGSLEDCAELEGAPEHEA